MLLSWIDGLKPLNLRKSCHLKPEAREDATQEVIANALVASARLAQLGKSELAYPSVLARYAVAQFQDGRRLGNRRNVREVLSPYAQKRK